MSKVVEIGGRLVNKETGGVVTGANAILDDTKGKKQDVINGEVDAELERLGSAKQDVLSFDNAPTEGSNNPVKSGGVFAADKALSDAIEAILVLIPSAASALNKLADMAFVNSTVSTNTATFRGTYNSVSGLSLPIDATHEQIATALGSVIATADNNDYAFVQVPTNASTPTEIAKTERYKFNGTNWAYEYDLNTSGFTAAQWAAINSSITAALVAKLSALPTNQELTQALAGKQDNLTFDQSPTENSTNPVTSGGVYAALAAIMLLVPSEATSSNKLADKAFVATSILNAIPTFKGTFTTAAELDEVTGMKDGDIALLLSYDSDGETVYTIKQYVSDAWITFFALTHRLLKKPATTGTTGDYPYNGMGRVVLPKNIQSVNGTDKNLLTQDMFYKGEVGSRVPNVKTIFVIQYDFTLGEDITVPENCVLEFDGGSIDDGTINLNNAQIISRERCFGTNLTLSGYGEIEACWFGVSEDNDDNSIAFAAMMSQVSGCTIIFHSARYKTSTTLNIKGGINIAGNPEFHATSDNINCVHVTGANCNKFEFRVARQLPSVWANSNSIGVILENCYRSEFNILYVDGFAYGVICRASTHPSGFAWNNLNIKGIRNAFRGLTIDSIESGWPNANNVYNIEFPIQSTSYNPTGASGRGYAIGFKTDNTYGCNSWNFYGACFEGSNTIGGVTYDFVNACDFCGDKVPQYCHFIDSRIEVTGHVLRIKSTGSRDFRFINPLVIIGTLAVDENNNPIMEGYISPVSGNDYLLDKISLGNETEELEVLDAPSMAYYGNKFRLSKGNRYVGVGIYGTMSPKFDAWSNSAKCIIVNNFVNVPFTIKKSKTSSSVRINFFDEKFSPISASTITFIRQSYQDLAGIRLVETSTSTYVNCLIGTSLTECNFMITSAGNAKYMAIGLDGNDTMYIYTNTPVPTIVHPWELTGEAYCNTDEPDVMRTAFKTGDEYYCITSNKLYKFIKGGSYGTTDATATGSAGSATVSMSAVSGVKGFVAGDRIKIGADTTEYRIVYVDRANNKVYLNIPLNADASGAAVTFVNPEYTIFANS